MKLRRGFIDVKRLATIGVNNIVRTPWLLDYIKSAVKPLEYVNNNNNELFKSISYYTLYNGQKLTLKTFVDDFYDIEERRTILTEGNEESYSFYGYVDNEGNYVDEIDPNQTSLNGYNTLVDNFFNEYTLEVDIEGNKPLYGYMMFNPGNPLQDVEEEYITDSYNEFIYTSEDASSNYKYIWFLENKTTDGLVIYLHEDVYDLLTQQQLETLYEIVGKYIIQPLTYKIDKYN